MPRVPYTKAALRYADQLQQLKDRGLVVEKDRKALHLLENISYYRLSGYWYPMLEAPKTAHIFKLGSTFNNAFKLYCFDRELRKLVLGELEKIEVAVRAKMIYVLWHRHGAFWFNDSTLFADRNKLASSIRKLREENRRSDEEFIKTFRRNYSDPLPPACMILEISSFGNLSSLYSNLNPGRNKREIANYFGVDDSTFSSWLHSFTYVRNVCAHHSRLWNKRLGISPQIPTSPINTFLNHTIIYHQTTGRANNDRTYFLLSMILYLLNIINPKHKFKSKLYKLLKAYPMVDVRAMGFPANWETEPIWN
jgi:abortive infection bacteriophage resistance protein